MDQNNDNKIDLILPDANPLHKDIYVEVDYMTAHKPWVQAISDVISSFERAPVTNPDGYNGINLHVDVDEQISHQPTTDMASLITIRNSNFGTMGQRADPNSVNVIGAKLMAYHYALFGHSQPGTSSSGRSNGIPSMEFLVSLGAPGWGIDPLTGHNVGSTDQQEGTFMHELGHNLNLHHGGSDDINCKPNYLSIMSYSRQFSSLIGDRPLDYSRSVLSSLPENNLDENLGISVSTPLGLRTIYGPLPGVITTAGSPDDWSGDVDTIDIGVARDLNNVDSCPVSPGEVLNGYDDWNGLIYVTTPAAGLSTETTMTNETLSPEGNATVSSSPENNPALDELTANDVRQHRNQLLEGINDTINSLPSTAFIQPTEAEAIKADLTTEPQSRLANISTLLQTDKLDAAIADLNLLKNQTDSSIGGLARDDEITSLPAQQKGSAFNR